VDLEAQEDKWGDEGRDTQSEPLRQRVGNCGGIPQKILLSVTMQVQYAIYTTRVSIQYQDESWSITIVYELTIVQTIRTIEVTIQYGNSGNGARQYGVVTC
jgi:hypothetical protein